ncbi:MAG: hypothetical protein NVSMB42_11230 [Herpetosiphon sp.]
MGRMLTPGSLVAGRYRLQGVIGTGGMGSVYQALDERLGRQVALKLLRPDFAAVPKERERFLGEARIAAQVVHPNIVRTYDTGEAPEGPYLVQELLEGVSLAPTLPLAVPKAIGVADGIAGALQSLHEHGYVHCDVKPQNIWLRPTGEPVLLDFGIARAQGSNTTTLVATPSYLAPERANGSAPTAASDLYALGVVLFQMVTGRLPFDGSTMQDILAAHAQAPIPPTGIADAAAPGLDRIITRLLAKDPADRYSSAAALKQDLQALQSGPVATSGVSAAHQLPTVAIPLAGHGAAPPLAAQQNPRGSRHRWMGLIGVPLALLALLLFAKGSGRSAAQKQLPAATNTAAAAMTTRSGLGAAAVSNMTASTGSTTVVAPTASRTFATAPAAAPSAATRIQVPNLTGKTVAQAATILQPLGLRLQVMGKQISPLPIDQILSQMPGPTAQLTPPDVIQVTLSAGPPILNGDANGDQEGNDMAVPPPVLVQGKHKGNGK